ncbi:MAG: TonB-linked SusC/RagA family outer membrane protein [Marinoscillum sp.]|jgi:TonB-linked SusC/RagA family outer membrane protein
MKKYLSFLKGILGRSIAVAGISFMCLFPCDSFAQERTVSGTIIDESDGVGVPGVTVLIKGTSTGTTTDFNGNFKLNVSDGAVLILSFIGYQTEQVAIGSRSVIDVSLALDIEELAEVVVIGYGKVEKGDVTGVVNKIDSKQFNRGMMTSPEQLIAGKVAGVQITSNDGSPGGGISIRMRGGTSLNASNDPLFVVDGIPLDGGGVAGGRNPLNFINPSDIADITVLKDASAAAIYGSRGANGVIIITTKTGKPGKVQISYDGSYSVSNIVDRVRMLTTPEFRATVENEGKRNFDDLGESDTDWLDEVLQTAQGQNHNVGVSFGGETYNGRVSLNYQNLDGILKTSNTERLAASVNLNKYFLKKDLTLNFNMKSTITNNRFAPNVVGGALVFDPTQAIFAEDSTTGGYFEFSNPLAPANPVATIDQIFNIGRTQRNLIGASAVYNLPFIKGLSVKVNYALDMAEGYSQVSSLPNAKVGRNRGGFSYYQDSKRSNLVEAYVNYNTKLSFGKADFIAGYSYQDFTTTVNKSYSLAEPDTINYGLLNISDPLTFLTNGELDDRLRYLQTPLTNNLENRLISFWGRANFSVLDKYLVTFTLRQDGSTRFGKSNRWGLFPSLALGWRILDESFAGPLKGVFSDLKLRMSYGVTGNQGIGDYLYVNLYEPGGERAQYILGGDTITTYRPNAVDPDIKWEETTSFNAGLDYGLFGGRLYGSLDVYRKLTTDLLFNIAFPIGTLTGDRAVTNIGELENKGIELMVNSVAIDKSDLKLNLTFNAALNKNEILKLDNSNLPDFQGYTTGGISGDVGQSVQILRVGYPANSFFVYEHRLVNGAPISDNVDFNGDKVKNDLDIYIDQNEDGRINEDDLRPYKRPAPDFILGLTGNLQYKKFEVAMTFRSQIGGYVYNNVESQYGAYEGVNNPFAPNNIHISAYDNDFSDRQLLSDIYIENASFLKLDNITLSYNFDLGSKIKSRAYFTASNLMTITGYNGLDPEAGIGGIDNNLYPRSRTFVVGVNVNFN